jgi:hypothetical protein
MFVRDPQFQDGVVAATRFAIEEFQYEDGWPSHAKCRLSCIAGSG